MGTFAQSFEKKSVSQKHHPQIFLIPFLVMYICSFDKSTEYKVFYRLSPKTSIK